MGRRWLGSHRSGIPQEVPMFPPFGRVFCALAVLTTGTVSACSESTSPEPTQVIRPSFGAGTTGNGAPSGAHYTLNIIGVPKDKSPDFSGGNGHRIFVDLGKTGEAANTRINLSEGDFSVTDANG